MRGTPFLYTGFTGGLNSIDSPFTLDDSESRDCLNVLGTTRGAIVKRNGSSILILSPPAAEITSIFPATISGNRFLIMFAGTKVYSVQTAGAPLDIAGAGIDITGSATITSGTRWEGVQAPTSTGVGG